MYIRRLIVEKLKNQLSENKMIFSKITTGNPVKNASTSGKFSRTVKKKKNI